MDKATSIVEDSLLSYIWQKVHTGLTAWVGYSFLEELLQFLTMLQTCYLCWAYCYLFASGIFETDKDKI